jgi:phosphopentomutase
MMSTSKRTYYLFRDGLVSGTTSTFNLFIAAQESMMSFPALSTLTTTTLHDQNGALVTVNSVSVLASTDGSTWSSPAAETATGHWSLSGLSGLVSGQTGTIYIKLNVNGEDKTTDGNAASGANGYAVFTVTP